MIPSRTTRHTVAVGVLAWAVVLVGLRVSVALPEACPDVDVEALTAAAREAVGWLDRNQAEDGSWTYLYRPGADEELAGGYNLVRHAGVTMSLYQAAAAGLDDAVRVADAGLTYARARLVPAGDGRAFGVRGATVDVGASALLIAGLAQRREHTGDRSHDGLLRDLGRFAAGQVRDDGSVLAAWDPATGSPVPDRVSVYFTGEVGWALARLHEVFPDEGWDAPAGRILAYLRVRDDVEDRLPPTPDHWGAYLVDSLSAAGPLPPDGAAVARRLAGILSTQARFQAKAYAGLGAAIGGPVRAAAEGTTGEGLAALWRAAGRSPDLARMRPVLAEGARCAAARLVDKQVAADEAPGFGRPDIARGAWFAGGETRMDDQQHALSALLGARTILTEAP